MFWYFDWTWILIIPALILSIYAQSKVTSTFNKYNKVHSSKNLTGAQVARQILDGAGIHDVDIQQATGRGLSDHFDPRTKAISLSAEVFGSTSVSAIGVAAHECGHAIQQQVDYFPNKVRSSLIPVAQLGSTAAIPLFIIGLLFAWTPLIDAGIILFSLVVVFYLAMLPVEIDASKRAIAILGGEGYLSPEELQGSKKVLQAAAFTYIASALTAILQLLRLILISNNRRR